MNMRIYEPKKLTELQNQLIRGSLLGDAWMSHPSGPKANSRVHFVQGVKQYEYLNWKYNMLKDWVLTLPHGSIGTEYRGRVTHFQTISHPVFTAIYNELYMNRGKVITPKYLSQVGDLGLAVLYQDDGSIGKGYIKFHTESFPLKECQILSTWLLSLGIESHISNERKYHVISIMKRESRIELLKRVKPFIVSCLSYKLAARRVKKVAVSIPMDIIKERHCKICGKPFPPYKSKVVCSLECRRLLLNKIQRHYRCFGKYVRKKYLPKEVIKLCPICNCKFQTKYRSITCSHKCGAIMRWMRLKEGISI